MYPVRFQRWEDFLPAWRRDKCTTRWTPFNRRCCAVDRESVPCVRHSFIIAPVAPNGWRPGFVLDLPTDLAELLDVHMAAVWLSGLPSCFACEACSMRTSRTRNRDVNG